MGLWSWQGFHYTPLCHFLLRMHWLSQLGIPFFFFLNEKIIGLISKKWNVCKLSCFCHFFIPVAHKSFPFLKLNFACHDLVMGFQRRQSSQAVGSGASCAACSGNLLPAGCYGSWFHHLGFMLPLEVTETFSPLLCSLDLRSGSPVTVLEDERTWDVGKIRLCVLMLLGCLSMHSLSADCWKQNSRCCWDFGLSSQGPEKWSWLR